MMENLSCLSYTRSDNCTSYENCAKPVDCQVGGLSKQHCFVVWEVDNRTTATTLLPNSTPASQNVVHGGCMPSYDGRACGERDCIGQHKGNKSAISKMFYCCCTKDLCNMNFVTPEAAYLRLNHSETPQFNSHESIDQSSRDTSKEYTTPTYLFWIVIPVLLLLVLLISFYVYLVRKKGSTLGLHKLNENNNNNNQLITRRNQNMTLNDRELTELRNNNDTSLLEPLRGHLGGEEHFFNQINNNKMNHNHVHSHFHQQQQQHPHHLNHNYHLVHTNALNTTFIKNNSDNRQTDILSSHPDETSSTIQANNRIDLSNVKLKEIIGSGRFGTVHRAMIGGDNDEPEVEVAVKIIAGSEHQSWLNEQQIYNLPRIIHQNILKFFYSEENPSTNTYWLIVEYASEGSLHNFLKKNTVNWKEFLHIALGIVHGLSHLHEADIAHRDFKSKNILLKNDLTACITDFGVADILDTTTRSQLDQRKKYLQVGTPRYMAPEVLECSVTFTKASFTKIDVYALSLVLWELLSRCHPLPTQDSDSDPAPYRLPFEDIAGPNPDINEMRQIVVVDKMRPPIKEEWRAYSASEFCRAIEDGWEYDHDARISASCFVERVESLPKT